MSMYIVLTGTTGVGKSTLTRRLASKYHFKAFYEHLDDNPYLPEYYAGQGKSVCFEMQTYFLSQRIRQQKEIEKILHTGTSVIHDRSIYEDFHIFATHQYNLGYMTKRQFENYRQLFFTVTELLYPPDLVIYLHASTERLLSHIQQRGRDYEQSIDRVYLSEINALYQAWMQDLKCDPISIPICSVDICQQDLEEADFDILCKSLEPQLAFRQHRNHLSLRA